MIRTRLTLAEIAGLLLALTLMALTGEGQASLYTPEIYYKHGAVYARELVKVDGYPIYVEYDESGKEISGGLYQPDNLTSPQKYQVYSAERYRAIITQYNTLLENYAQSGQDAPLLIERSAFEAGGFTTVNGESIAVSSSMLRSDTVKVVVAAPGSRYSTDPKQLLLLELPIDPEAPIGTTSRSLLLKVDETARTVTVAYESPNNIGYRVGFFGDGANVSTSVRTRDDQIYGPLVDIPVRTFAAAGAAITDSQGKYNMQYMLPPCPGFTFDYSTPAYVELYFKRFSPTASATVPYYLIRPDWDFCNGLAAYPPSYTLGGLMTQIAVANIVNSTYTVKPNIDFPIDIMVMSGQASIKNNKAADNNENVPVVVAVGGATQYDSSGGELLKRMARQEYDLDGDGTSDTTALGKIVTDAEGNKTFIKLEPDASPEVQGVWLSSLNAAPTFNGDTASSLPDLTRLPDWSGDFRHHALLSQISAEDLADTDLYVFRESDGSLLMERKGLSENERFFGVNEGEGKFFYTIRLVGSRGRLRGTNPITESQFSQWQQEEGVVDGSPLYQREADHLRPGERVRLIAINRASGYLGSHSVALQAASTGSNDMEISFNIDEFELLPPNLKVWAERQSRTELGMTKDEVNRYLVGSEGAGMSTDQFIVIYSEWLDPEGLPLPEELADYGYTARLARIVSENTLDSADSIDSIAIKPGKQMALIRLPESGVAPSNLTIGEETQYYAGNEHFYVQVSGQPHTREADFSSSGQAQMLAHRPTRFVPVLAPVFDEETTNLSIKTWNSLRESNPDLNRPEPVYQWSYRPEYQFSVYDLRMREINRQDVLGETQNILSLEEPVISSSDEAIQLLYDLTGPSVDGLSLNTLDAYSYGENKELVFAFGEQEISATVDGDGQIVFDDVSQLSSLSAEDYLSIRLYTNNDPENILWEFAFQYLAIDTTNPESYPWNGDYYEVSADNPVVELQAWLVGFESTEQNPVPVAFWSQDGEGALESFGNVTGNEAGYFRNKLMMPNEAGSTSDVYLFLPGGDVRDHFGTVRVIPGNAASVTLATNNGKAHVFESGEVEITATITDLYGNSVADGTPVDWGVVGDARLKSSETTTTGGRAVAVLVGGGVAGEAQVMAETNGIQQVAATEILPLNISVSAASTVEADSIIEASVSVTDTDGNAVSNIFFMPASTVGRVSKESQTTNASGSATFRIKVQPKGGDGVIGVRLGEQIETVAVTVQQDTTVPQLDTDVLLVGNKSVDGTVQVNWIGDVNVDVPYKSSDQLTVVGQPGESVLVELGSPGIPVIMPVLSYRMNEQYNGNVVTDAIGGIPTTSDYIDVVRDAPLGVGSSFAFKKKAWQNPEDETDIRSSRVLSSPSLRLSLTEDVGFRLDLKVLAIGGEIFRWGDGQSLSLNDSGQLIYTVVTDVIEQSLISESLIVGQWYNITGHYRNSQLVLNVNSGDGKHNLHEYSASLTGQVQYGATEVGLSIGVDLEARMRGFEIYNWRKLPLVTLDGDVNELTVVLDEQGKAQIGVHSMGLYGEDVTSLEAREGLLKKLPVTISYPNKVGKQSTAYITMLNEDGYRSLVASRMSSTPIPESALLAMQQHRGYQDGGGYAAYGMIPYAHAGFMDWVPSVDEIKSAVNQAVEVVAEAATWIVPYDDALTIAEQLEYFANDDPRYNPMLLAASSLSVLSVIPTPFTKALKPIMKPIKKLAQLVGRGKFGSSFAKKFLELARGCVDESGKGSSCDRLKSLMPFLEIVGYMYLADPEGFEDLLTSIQSEEDFLVLLDFFTMEIDPDWFGVTEELASLPPAIEYLGLPNAHASIGVTEKFGKAIMHLYKSLKAKGVIDKDVSLIKVLRPFVKLKPWFKEKDRTEILKRVVNIKFLKMAAITASRRGAETVIGIIKGYSGQRIPRPIVWGMLYYLLVDQKDAFEAKGIYDDIWKKVGVAFINVSSINRNPKVCPQDQKDERYDGSVVSKISQANGALYHLSQVATLSLFGFTIEGIERKENVVIYTEIAGVKKKFSDWGRDIDIVISSGGKEILVETKSLSAYKGPTEIWKNNYFSEWTKLNGETTLMRQFMLDRVVAGADSPDSKIRWYFDKFVNKAGVNCGTTYSGFDDKSMSDARGVMKKVPTWFKNKHAKGTFNMKLTTYKDIYTDNLMKNIVINQNFVEQAFDALVSQGFSFVKTLAESDSVEAQVY